MNKAERVVSLHQSGVMHCAQAMLYVYGPELGMDENMALKVAAGFGGGIGKMAGVCGSITGAIMVLGLGYNHQDSGSRDRINGLVQRFIREFTARHGSILCRDLLGNDISTTEGLRNIRDQKITSIICPRVGRDAAEILETLLKENLLPDDRGDSG